MSKTVGGNTTGFTWDVVGGLPLLLTEKTNQGTTSYIYGPGGLPLEQITSSGTVTYYHQDQLGSTRALTNSSGTVVATYTYDPYGNLSGSTGTATNPFRYAGQYTDDETGFVYLRARYYDPSTGQFITVDPAYELTRSRYGYVDGDPLNGVDPLGLWGLKNISKFVRDHGAKIAIGAAIVGGAVCIATVACATAAVLAVNSVSPIAASVLLAGGGTTLAAAGTRAQVLQNKDKGDAFRDEIAQRFASNGYNVATEVCKKTPFGRRFIDIEVSKAGQVLGGLETKTGGSPYTPAQRAKDAYLGLTGYVVNVVRDF